MSEGLGTNKPLNTFSLEQSLYYGKNLFQNLIRSGATGKEIVQVIDVLIAGINKQIGLDCYVGDVNACNLEEQTKLCYILNTHLDQMNQLLTGLNQLRLQVQGLTPAPTPPSSGGGSTTTPPAVSNSYFVKVKNDPAEVAGPLIDKLKSDQPNGLLYDAATTTLKTGTFMPPGSVFMITKRYLVNFDTTGLGKQATDFYPFAIADGRNGTDNLLVDTYLKFVGNINDADAQGGVDKFVVNAANLGSLNIAIAGSLNDALTVFNLNANMDVKMGSLSAGGDMFYVPKGSVNSSPAQPLQIEPGDALQHSHLHNLSANSTNPNPTPIDLNPKFLKLVPIQTIKR